MMMLKWMSELLHKAFLIKYSVRKVGPVTVPFFFFEKIKIKY